MLRTNFAYLKNKPEIRSKKYKVKIFSGQMFRRSIEFKRKNFHTIFVLYVENDIWATETFYLNFGLQSSQHLEALKGDGHTK